MIREQTAARTLYLFFRASLVRFDRDGWPDHAVSAVRRENVLEALHASWRRLNEDARFDLAAEGLGLPRHQGIASPGDGLRRGDV